MDYRLEKLLNRQIELIEILQDRADEVLDWRTSPENAESVVAYFEALEYAVQSLDNLSKFCQENKEWRSEDDDRNRNRDRNDNDEYRISDRTRDDRDDYDNRRR